MGTGKKKEPEISLEEYLWYQSAAYKRDNIKAMRQLSDRYPELLGLSADEEYMAKKENPADSERYYCHPIVMNSTRMSELRVLDMVAYLYCQNKTPSQFIKILREKIAYRTIFNYEIDRYQRDYNRKSLWDDFFNGVPELCQRINQRRIRDLAELEYRAAEYFEDICAHELGEKIF